MATENVDSSKVKQLRPYAAVIPQTQTKPLEERLAAGKALRGVCSRSTHAGWTPPQNRRDPVDILIESSQGRMEELLPIRYGRMAANPFAFFRGAASIMAYDLSHTPSTGLYALIGGDCHLLNFGGFATTERRLIFDINDFDEAFIAPWEWDLKRLATSFVIAARANKFDDQDGYEAALAVGQSYRNRMAEYTTMSILDVWNDSMNLKEIITNMQNNAMKAFYTKKLTQATDKSAHEKEFAKLTYKGGDTPRIIDQPPLIFHVSEFYDGDFLADAQKTVIDYLQSISPERRVLLSRFQLVDLAFKVVGVGSVGTYCGIALFMSGNGDPLFLQFKQAESSVLEPYSPAEAFPHAGQRVVVSQRLMQAASDMFLGWYTGRGKNQFEYYVRQLRDAKIKPVVEIMGVPELKNYASLCGRTLARAHARSADVAVLSGYLGKSSSFEKAIAQFGMAYADQNDQDYQTLMEAIKSGKIEAELEG